MIILLKNHIKYSYLAAYETVKNFVEKGENIEKYEELLNCLASALGIEKKTNERIKQVH